MTRRQAIATASSALVGLALDGKAQASGVHFSVAEFDRARILLLADSFQPAPLRKLASVAAPGAKSRQRFFCNAAMDPATGQVTGFTGHCDLLAEVAARIAAWVAAWRLTGNAAYLEQARAQLQAWCIEPSTRMEPTLENEAAAPVEDPDLRLNPLRFTLPLAELARASAFVCAAPDIPQEEAAAVRAWFAALLNWFTDSERAAVAKESTRADAIFWTVQAGELARFTRNDTAWRDCGHRFRDKLLRQLHLDGYFPYALSVRRPYAESLLLLECMGTACESLSTPFDSVWNFALADGRGMRPAIAWAAPYLRDRGKWPYVADVRLFSEEPLRENALLFAARAWNRQDYADLWKTMTPDSTSTELRREHPITQPALWAVRPPA